MIDRFYVVVFAIVGLALAALESIGRFFGRKRRGNPRES